ncbi:unnamed protein product [Acanthoscelides obtectus]|uniref:Endonuclease/exonuclease/phosphatase domain-containing protein n=1 Tax=Acanthoscelides obtectus TaxID=200917 RepID=A0A9P0QCV6_ACAOB|nr:unnamed protein product [Acanthoscelides obtectus]CAK1670305.1 RNA-directed DNA polymerase from mobile element jockey [Acanthoscelides obtectus]
MSFNVRSIQSGFLTLKEYVVDCAVDVLGLSETWLTPDIDSSSVFINDFNVVRADRNSRGGGVAFYVRNGIAFKILHSNITAVLEELWISVKVNQRKYCLAIVYRPPSANVLDCFHQLTESLTNLSLDNDYAIVMGDFNINVLVNDGRSEMLNCFLESFDLSQLVKEPTRITSNSQTAIDLLMVSSADIISSYEVVDVDGISDHLALIFYVDASEISNLCKLRTYRDYSTFSLDNFYHDLLLINWDFIYTLRDVDQMIDFLSSNILCTFNLHAPVRNIRVTKPPAPWRTFNIKLMMRTKSDAYKKFKRTGTIAAWEFYKKIRNYVSSAIRREKKAYLDYVMRHKNSKTTWNILRSLNIVKHNSISLPPHLQDLDSLNSAFLNVPQTTKSLTQLNLLDKYENVKNSGTFLFTTVSPATVAKFINRIKSHAKGSDGITIDMIRIIHKHLLKYITFIINFCITNNLYPSSWKNALVLPLPKSNYPSSFSDLRPISILPSLSKLLEMALHEQLHTFVCQNNLLTWEVASDHYIAPPLRSCLYRIIFIARLIKESCPA